MFPLCNLKRKVACRRGNGRTRSVRRRSCMWRFPMGDSGFPYSRKSCLRRTDCTKDCREGENGATASVMSCLTASRHWSGCMRPISVEPLSSCSHQSSPAPPLPPTESITVAFAIIPRVRRHSSSPAYHPRRQRRKQRCRIRSFNTNTNLHTVRVVLHSAHRQNTTYRRLCDVT